MSSFKPLNDRVLVKPQMEDNNKKIGNIIIPDTAKEKPMQGIVIAVGEGKRDNNGNIHAMSLKKGDKVLYSKYAGTEVKIDDEDFIIMSENDVLGIMC